uniref:HAT C-terminal dimerisation domain-containing protein n=1 Tax=Ananas comosus var. bracteatus TaxID=296719 RepID=A0A6V7PXT6_ANACO|nr:unnamed protein product [Ananas comosus var. bracteatus]
MKKKLSRNEEKEKCRTMMRTMRKGRWILRKGGSRGDEEGDREGGHRGGIMRFDEGCRAFRFAFLKIMKKKLPNDALGPMLSAHKKLIAEKLAEEEAEHKVKGEAKKEKMSSSRIPSSQNSISSPAIDNVIIDDSPIDVDNECGDDEDNNQLMKEKAIATDSPSKKRGRKKTSDVWKSFKKIQTVDSMEVGKSELEIYLEEQNVRCNASTDKTFDVLNWWKVNSHKFPILSQMAKDILSVLITTVTSESAFSAGGRVLTDYRSSLSTSTVEALVCGGNGFVILQNYN